MTFLYVPRKFIRRVLLGKKDTDGNGEPDDDDNGSAAAGRSATTGRLELPYHDLMFQLYKRHGVRSDEVGALMPRSHADGDTELCWNPLYMQSGVLGIPWSISTEKGFTGGYTEDNRFMKYENYCRWFVCFDPDQGTGGDGEQ